MSTSTAEHHRSSVRHSKEQALSPLQFERLIEESYELKRFWDLEARLILFLAGRLGMRRGEIAHLDEAWIEWRRERITIPAHYTCDRGRDGGRCGTCVQQAEQMADHNDDITLEQALATRWSPKTPSAARSIPFGHSTRARIAIEDYFGEFDQWMYSASVISRRLDRLVDNSDAVDSCHPHALRATAATYWAGRDIDAFALKNLMGWADLQTALRYIGNNADRLDTQLKYRHQ